MSVLQRCLSDRESNEGSKERQRPTLSVRQVLQRSSSYREPKNKGSKERWGPTLDVRQVLQRSLSYRESNKGSKERQGPTLGVPFT